MKPKRLLSLFLILALCLGLTACTADVTVDVTTDSTTSTTTTTATEAETDTADGDSSSSITTTTTASPSSNASITTTLITTAKPTTSQVTKPTPTEVTIPTTTGTTVSAADKQLVDRAFGLAQGAKMENVTLTGVVTSSQGYSAGYNNATFDLQVEGTSGVKTIYCYRVKPADSAHTEVSEGDRLSLTGTIQNYKGTIEFYPATYTYLSGGGAVVTTTRPTAGTVTIDEDGIYDSKEEVALYIHTYGKLPKNYVTKSRYNKSDRYQCVGGDRFYNKEGRLPNGETYYECDIDTYGITSRGAKRLVWTKSGIVYYTGDHYETFTKLYGER